MHFSFVLTYHASDVGRYDLPRCPSQNFSPTTVARGSAPVDRNLISFFSPFDQSREASPASKSFVLQLIFFADLCYSKRFIFPDWFFPVNVVGGKKDARAVCDDGWVGPRDRCRFARDFRTDGARLAGLVLWHLCWTIALFNWQSLFQFRDFSKTRVCTKQLEFQYTVI